MFSSETIHTVRIWVLGPLPSGHSDINHKLLVSTDWRNESVSFMEFIGVTYNPRKRPIEASGVREQQ
jgi:hypothetical protein